MQFINQQWRPTPDIPIQYLQFFSPYAKENTIKEVVKKYDKGITEIQKFSEDGYLKNITINTPTYTRIENFYYNSNKTEIVKISAGDRESHVTATITSFYFNKNYTIDSINNVIFKESPKPEKIITNFFYDEDNLICSVKVRSGSRDTTYILKHETLSNVDLTKESVIYSTSVNWGQRNGQYNFDHKIDDFFTLSIKYNNISKKALKLLTNIREELFDNYNPKKYTSAYKQTFQLGKMSGLFIYHDNFVMFNYSYGLPSYLFFTRTRPTFHQGPYTYAFRF